MALMIPTLDDRSYQDLLDEALARIPVHNPEWTNFNRSDPGVTLIELFAFLTENLLYRSNQIPERNRLKFLTLLGLSLQPASPAQGLVTFSNERGPLRTITLNDGLEVRAGQVPFRTTQGLDVLPIEAQTYYKHPVSDPTLTTYYGQLYASYKQQVLNLTPQLYETLPLQLPSKTTNGGGVDLGLDTVDTSIWVALLTRVSDKPSAETVEEARRQIAGKTISLGIVPLLTGASRVLAPPGQTAEGPTLHYFMPNVGSPDVPPEPTYRQLDAAAATDVLAQPGVVRIALPTDPRSLSTWTNFAPLEAGVGGFPPALDDTNLSDRLITWLRISPPTPENAHTAGSLRIKLLWVDINTTAVTQRAYVASELLPPATGEPDQSVTLSKTPVIPETVQLTVTLANGTTERWARIDDLFSAGPEVPVPDPRLPPSTPSVSNQLVKVFTIDAVSGEIRFGDGTRGARPPFGATLRVNYAYGVGPAGNVGAHSINSSPALPAGVRVTNPVRTWGGADAETVSDGEKQMPRYLQNRDRLVNATDFETITLRTPGVDIGRVEVISAYSPELASNDPGDAPGAVTLMVIPKYDLEQPDAPMPDRIFLDTICTYLDPRRLVTTEVFLRGPTYKAIWVSIGIQVVPGASVAQVREAVRSAVMNFLSPLPTGPDGQLATLDVLLTAPQQASMQRGWPLRKPVVDLELVAVASRVAGVLFVNGIALAQGTQPAASSIPMNGLELPRLLAISVTTGDPVNVDQLRGTTATTTTPKTVVPIPVIPEECN